MGDDARDRVGSDAATARLRKARGMASVKDGVSLDQTGDLREWQNVLSSSMYQLQVSPMGRQEFSGSIRTRRIGDVSFSLIKAQPHRVLRQPTAGDRFGLSLQLSGQSSVSQGGKTDVLGPGDYCTYDSLLPYSRVFEEPTLSFVVLFPRSLLLLPENVLHEAEALVMRPEGGFNSLYSDLLQGISHRLDDLDSFTGYRAARALIELLSTSLIHNLKAQPFAKDTAAEQLKLSILDYIGEHLSDSELSAGTIAANFYISTRYLFQLFSGQSSTLAQLIRTERLLLAESKLSDPSLQWVPIAQISELCGYVNANYFSRVFKEHYGSTPSQYRDDRAAQAGMSAR